MPFVVEDGSGLSTAESYLSEADFEAYCTAHGLSIGAATSAQEEVSLREATQYLDGKYGGTWIGDRGSREQALDWPREFAWDADGGEITDSELPVEVENACAELAFKALSDTLFPDVTASAAGVTSRSVTVGPISKAVSWSGGGPSSPIYRKVDGMLRRLLRPAELMRA